RAIAGGLAAIRTVGLVGAVGGLATIGTYAIPIAAVGLSIGAVVAATKNLKESKQLMEEFGQAMGFTAEQSKNLSEFMKRGFGQGQEEFNKSLDAIRDRIIELERVSGKSVSAFSSHLERIKFGEHLGTANLDNA